MAENVIQDLSGMTRGSTGVSEVTLKYLQYKSETIYNIILRRPESDLERIRFVCRVSAAEEKKHGCC